MARELKVDTILKLHILISLKKGATHGYDLMKGIEESLGRKISASLIYPFLKQMKSRQYVTITQKGREKQHSLTQKGKKFVNKTLLRFHDIIKESISDMLTPCYHCGCLVYNNDYKEKVKGKERYFCCSHYAASYKKMKS